MTDFAFDVSTMKRQGWQHSALQAIKRHLTIIKNINQNEKKVDLLVSPAK
jgi:hypothetical protein